MKTCRVRMLAFCLLSGTVFGQGVPWGRAVPVRQLSLSPYSMAPRADGGVVAVWPFLNPRTGGYDLQWESFDSAFVSRGTKPLVSDVFCYPQFQFQITALKDGDFILCWVAETGHGKDVFSRRFNFRGEETGPLVQVNMTGVENVLPRTSALANGGFVVVWERMRIGSDVMARLFNADGTPPGAEFRVCPVPDAIQQYPFSVAGGDGGFLIQWDGPVTSTGNQSVFLRCFDEGGIGEGDAIRVFDTLQGISPCDRPVTVLRNGGVIAVGIRFNPANPFVSDVRFKVFPREGLEYGPVAVVNEHHQYMNRTPSVIALTNGGFAVAWVEAETPPVYREHVALRCYDGDCHSMGDEMRLGDPEKDGFLSSLCPLSGGGFVVAWQEADGMLFMKPFRDEPLVHTLVPFEALEPRNDLTLPSDSCTFSWQSATRQTVCYPWEVRYDVLLDDNPDFSSPERRTVDKDTFLVVSDLRPGATYFWKVLARNTAGDSLWSSDTNGFFVSLTGIRVGNPSPSAVPKRTGLLSNFPNPFNPRTRVTYALDRDAVVHLSVRDVRGRLIRRLVSGRKSAGIEAAEWDGCDAEGNSAAAGIYFAVLEADGIRDTRKMLLVK
jgi:hypothetical protein